MNPEARLWFLHTAAQVMLKAPDGAFLVVEVQGHPCEYAILERDQDSELALQVSCRVWDCAQCGNRPLPGTAVTDLEALGFAPPASHLNAWRADLPEDARNLAVLLERALDAAYRPPPDFEIALYAGRAQEYVQLVTQLS